MKSTTKAQIKILANMTIQTASFGQLIQALQYVKGFQKTAIHDPDELMGLQIIVSGVHNLIQGLKGSLLVSLNDADLKSLLQMQHEAQAAVHEIFHAYLLEHASDIGL